MRRHPKILPLAPEVGFWVLPAVRMIVRQNPALHGSQLFFGESDYCSFTSNTVADNPASFIVNNYRIFAIAFPTHLLLEPACASIGLGSHRQNHAAFDGLTR